MSLPVVGREVTCCLLIICYFLLNKINIENNKFHKNDLVLYIISLVVLDEIVFFFRFHLQMSVVVLYFNDKILYRLTLVLFSEFSYISNRIRLPLTDITKFSSTRYVIPSILFLVDLKTIFTCATIWFTWSPSRVCQ